MQAACQAALFWPTGGAPSLVNVLRKWTELDEPEPLPEPIDQCLIEVRLRGRTHRYVVATEDLIFLPPEWRLHLSPVAGVA
jgi:hypothetical protein